MLWQPTRYQVVDSFWASALSARLGRPHLCIRSLPGVIAPSVTHSPPSRTPGLVGALLLFSVVFLVNNGQLLQHSL